MVWKWHRNIFPMDIFSQTFFRSTFLLKHGPSHPQLCSLSPNQGASPPRTHTHPRDHRCQKNVCRKVSVGKTSRSLKMLSSYFELFSSLFLFTSKPQTYPLGTIPPGYHVHLPLSSLSDLPSSELATAIQHQHQVLQVGTSLVVLFFLQHCSHQWPVL